MNTMKVRDMGLHTVHATFTKVFDKYHVCKLAYISNKDCLDTSWQVFRLISLTTRGIKCLLVTKLDLFEQNKKLFMPRLIVSLYR